MPKNPTGAKELYAFLAKDIEKTSENLKKEDAEKITKEESKQTQEQKNKQQNTTNGNKL